MYKTLQQIKDEVFEQPMFTEEEDIDWVIDQVAIRYAQEQKRELLDMLARCEKVISELGIATDDIQELIKQAPEN